MKATIGSKSAMKKSAATQKAAPVGSTIKMANTKANTDAVCEEGYPKLGSFVSERDGKEIPVIVFKEWQGKYGPKNKCLGFGKIRMVLANAAACAKLLAEHDAAGGSED